MKKIICIILMIIIFESCVKPPFPTKTTPPVSITSKVTRVVEATEIIKPTDLPLPSPTSPRPAPTPSPTPELFKNDCINVETALDDKVTMDYSLVFSARKDGPKYNFIYSFKTGERIDFIEENKPQSTSFDGNWLTYLDFHFPAQPVLVVETYDKKIQKKFLIHQNWLWSFPWVDGNHIYISLLDHLVPYTLIIDVRTGEQTILQNMYPNLLRQWGVLYQLDFSKSSVVYDPSTDLIVYRKTVEDDRQYRYYLTLYNRRTNAELASLEDENTGRYPFHDPIWSVDGQEVIVGNYLKGVHELYSIQRDGQVSQLTHFRDNFQDLIIGGMSLSPDKKLLAFWVTFPETPNDSQLFLLNMLTKKATNLCISDVKEDEEAPIWSPDSRYFAVALSNKNDTHGTILVDPQAKLAFQVSDSSYPIGWLKEP